MKIKKLLFLGLAFLTVGILNAGRIRIHLITSSGCTIDIIGTQTNGSFEGTVSFGGPVGCSQSFIDFHFASPGPNNTNVGGINPNSPKIIAQFVGGHDVYDATGIIFIGNTHNRMNVYNFQDALDLLNLNNKTILAEMKKDIGI